MISLQKISKQFPVADSSNFFALREVDLEIQEGEYVIILGANGSGKSTLLNSIAGSVQLTEGNIIFEGAQVTLMPEHNRSKYISRVFQDPLAGTASDLTIIENFRLAALRTHKKTLRLGINEKFRNEVSEKVATLQLGLEKKLNRPVGSLSGGQRQALTLLMAVMTDSRLLLMDEPASALDPRTAQLIMELANKLIRENKLTAILVTHNLKDAMKYGDRIILMQEGKIVKDIYKNKEQISLEQMLDWF